ncbi:helix-turn-helix domain-containing protein [Microbacterium sp. zg.B48]|uniref:AraC family transcriptional regulator n=1 Tax=Microbacterium sp. zg.B48 TaxID=2969408 RepID=UPI00214C7543|nr:AraC family transcriptional regulator [Microbacterium sp. zg.B48]MCR2764832.1 helix-turn-helix domain-containing protein [Microbacterium sp. zg.B48]
MRDIAGRRALNAPSHGSAAGPRQGMAQLRLGHVVLFTTVNGICLPADLRRTAEDERRYTVLVHAGENGTSHSRIVCADTALDALIGMRGDLRAVAVPDRMLPPHSITPAAVPLAETALVRASRAVVGVLFSMAAVSAGGDSAAATEDVVVAMVRGILREQRPAMIGAGDGDEVEHRVWALIADRHPDPEFDVGTIARELAFSRRQLYRRVTGEAGVAALIAQHRLSTAMRLIGEDPSKPLADVASSSGFSRLANMRALFTARLGMTPTTYRRGILASRS